MISLLQYPLLRGCSTSGKPTCLCAEANRRVIHYMDGIGVQHYLWEDFLEELIQMSKSASKWRPFGDRDAIDLLDMRDSKSREFLAKLTDDLCNSIVLLSLKLRDLVRRFVRMECEEL